MVRSRKRLEEMASGFMPARILLSAVELGIFAELGRGALTAGDLSRRTRASAEPLARLLDALVALGILRKRRGLYRNSPAAIRHLSAGGPDYVGDIMLHRASLWERWGSLTEVIRTGKVPPTRRTRDQERRFIRGMANVGSPFAAKTARALKRELVPARRLLDLGGGPATYACAFARAYPTLRVTVLDLRGPLACARETIAYEGLSDRVSVRATDAVASPSYGRGYDVVFMSNFIHSFKRACARSVVEKAARALVKGGHLAVKDFFIGRERTSPPFAAIFSVNMLVGDAGDCYTREEVSGWMAEAGVAPRRFVELGDSSGILIGRKS